MAEDIRRKVREQYGRIATLKGSCCGPVRTGQCCSPSAPKAGSTMGYSAEELDTIPPEANLGLGCGSPLDLAALKPGETVLDLGSGGGIDCFLAAGRVGPQGRVIGVDMTPEMLHLARGNADRGDCRNVEFRLGEIEHLPVADASVDVVISNCVINLSVDKPQVFREIFRVLKPQGRMLVSDILLTRELPQPLRQSVALFTSCIAGAVTRREYLDAVAAAGFDDVRIMAETGVTADCWAEVPISLDAFAAAKLSKGQVREVFESIVSAKVHARKQK